MLDKDREIACNAPDYQDLLRSDLAKQIIISRKFEENIQQK